MCEIRVGNRKRGDKGVYVGRPSVLGNPFEIGRDGDREEVIAKYEHWLKARLQNENSAQSQAIEQLANEVRVDGKVQLVCWCAPLRCHAEVIREEIIKRL